DRVDPGAGESRRIRDVLERIEVRFKPSATRAAVVVQGDRDVEAFLIREVMAKVAGRSALVRLRDVMPPHDAFLRCVVEISDVSTWRRRKRAVAVVDHDDRNIL